MSITCALYLLFGYIMVQRWVCWIVGVSTFQVCRRYFFRGNSSVAFQQQRHHWCKKRYWSSVIVKIVREICLPAFPAYEKVYVVALVIEHTFYFFDYWRALFIFREKKINFLLFLGKFTQTVHHYRREIHTS